MSIVAVLKEYCQGTCQYISNIDSPGVYSVCVCVNTFKLWVAWIQERRTNRQKGSNAFHSLPGFSVFSFSNLWLTQYTSYAYNVEGMTNVMTWSGCAVLSREQFSSGVLAEHAPERRWESQGWTNNQQQQTKTPSYGSEGTLSLHICYEYAWW